MDVEAWAPVVGFGGRFDGLFQVSSHGNVRRVAELRGILTHPRPMRFYSNKDGYLTVHLSVGSKVSPIAVHRLVMEAFVGPLPPGLMTRHLDGDRANPRLDNIVYGTALENQEDKRRHGTFYAPLTACPQGHAYTPENTLARKDGRRYCRACNAEHQKRRHRRLREQGLNSKGQPYKIKRVVFHETAPTRKPRVFDPVTRSMVAAG